MPNKTLSGLGERCVLLTGAGASVPLKLATTVQFIDYLQGSLPPELINEALSSVLESCKPHAAMEAVDVEVVIDHINGCLDAAAVLREDVRLGRRLFGTNPPAEYLEKELEFYRVLRERIFDKVVEHYSTLDADKAASVYRVTLTELPKLVGATLPIFTLNYDLAVETACYALGIPYIDGIDRNRLERPWSSTLFNAVDPHSAGIVLFKLHGSVSWCRLPGGEVREILGTHRNPAPTEHVILYPSLRYKELETEPFKTGYDQLVLCLSRAQVLGVIGTTLRDAELLDIIRRSALENRGLRIIYAGPSAECARAARTMGLPRQRIAALQGKFGTKEFDDALVVAITRLLEGDKRLMGRTTKASTLRRQA